MNELVARIHYLRNKEGVPLSFRRKWLDKDRAIWYIWYGYTLIAYKTNQSTAEQAVEVAASIHRAIHEPESKAA